MSTPTPAQSRKEQRGIEMLLSTMDELAQIAVVSRFRGNTVAELGKALAGKFTAGKLPGAVIIVQQPDEVPSDKSSPVLTIDRTHTVTVVELVMENRKHDGTDDLRCGYTHEELKDLVMQRLHDRRMSNATLVWKKTVPFTDGKGGDGHEIIFSIRGQLASEVRGAEPAITFGGGNCTLIGAGFAGETIHYTTNGDYPFPGEDGVQTYTAPFAVSSGTTVIAASTATGRTLSGFQQKTSP